MKSGETAPIPEKTACVRDYPRPTTKKQLQSFISLAGFYKRFVPKFSVIIIPLFNLLSKAVDWRWSEAEKAAFIEVKRKFCSDSVILKLHTLGKFLKFLYMHLIRTDCPDRSTNPVGYGTLPEAM